MLSGNSWRLGRVGGVEINIHPSWSFIAFLVGYTFYLILSTRFEGETTAALITLAVVMTIVFFSSVLLHELAHSWFALARGVEVRGITLFLFGGATSADLETKEPVDELVISLAGPISSVLIAGALWGASLLAGDGPIALAAGQLGWINLALAVFNLLPGFPLDGGRVLRSLIWGSTGDLTKATRIASRGGMVLGFLIMAAGVFEVMFLGALVGGLWLVAIGWFLTRAAQTSFAHLQLREVLSDVAASQLMTREPMSMPGHLTVEDAIDDYFMRHNYNSFPVEDHGRTLGIITMRAVKELPRDQWRSTRVDEIMEPISDLCTVSPTDHVDDVVTKLMQGELRRVVVMDNGTVEGLITPSDMVRWLERSNRLGLSEDLPSITS